MLLKKHLTSMLTMSFFLSETTVLLFLQGEKNYNKIAIVQVHINISSIMKFLIWQLKVGWPKEFVYFLIRQKVGPGS